jgi:hypothetical protein
MSTDISPSAKIRSPLERCERLLATAPRCDASQLLLSAQEASDAIQALESGGLDVRAERERLRAIESRIVAHASGLVGALGGQAAFRTLRAKHAAGVDGPIWTLDAVIARKRRSLWQRIALFTGALALLGALAYAFRDTLLPPDPVGDALFAATRALERNDTAAAVAQIELGLRQAPTSTQLLVWRGVLLRDLGDPAADDAFAMAERESDRVTMLLERASAHAQLRRGQAVLADTAEAITLAPERPEIYLFQANGYELVNDRAAELTALERCAALAEAQGNGTLNGVARVRIAQMIAQGGGAAP